MMPKRAGAFPWPRPGVMALLAITVAYVGLIGAELVLQAQNWSYLHRERDFPSYYLAARRLWRGQDFYTGLQEEARSIGMDGYFTDTAVGPPTFHLLVAWLAFFPYPVAWGFWQVLSLLALGLALFLVAREVRLTLSRDGWIGLGCAVLLFPPLTFHMLYAHTELLILLCLAGAWVLLRRGKEIPAGILLGLAGVTRLYPLFLLFYLLLKRRWRALAAAGGTVLAWALLTGLAAGAESYLRYLNAMRSTITAFYALAGNASLWGSVHKLAAIWPALGAHPALRDALAPALSTAALLLSLWFAHRMEAERAYSLVIVGALLASPLSWVYYQVLLYLPFLLLIALARRSQRAVALRSVLLVTLAASFLPFIQVLPNLPSFLDAIISFGLSLPLIGTFVALVLAQSALPNSETPPGSPDAPNPPARPSPNPGPETLLTKDSDCSIMETAVAV